MAAEEGTSLPRLQGMTSDFDSYVVHCRRGIHDVYIGRPSKWGNPFVLNREQDREEVVDKYRSWVVTQPNLMESLPELRGKILGCWCSPKLCHGHVLAELANSEVWTPEWTKRIEKALVESEAGLSRPWSEVRKELLLEENEDGD